MTDDNENQPDESDLDMLLRLVDERQREMDNAAREKAATKKSIEATLAAEERRRAHDMTRLGSYEAAAAIQREARRKEQEHADVRRKQKEGEDAFREFYLANEDQ